MILTYHEITARNSSYRYSVSRQLLDEHLEVVARFRSLQGATAANLLVTFDDGERSNFVHGLDLLEEHSVPATFFVIAGWIGTMDGFMAWSEVKELVARGHQVQSHGWSHRPLTDCSDSEMADELNRSKGTLEDRLGLPVDSLSIPYGRWDDRLLRACAAAGYRRVYGSDPWLAPQHREGVDLIGRFMVQHSLQARHVRALLAGNPIYRFSLRSRYRAKEGLRSLMGHARYHKLWLFFAGAEDADTSKVLE